MNRDEAMDLQVGALVALGQAEMVAAGILDGSVTAEDAASVVLAQARFSSAQADLIAALQNLLQVSS